METASAPAASSAAAAGRPDPGAVGARLSSLFSAHGRTVLGLCRVLLRDPHEAEDAVQQTFLSAYRSMLNGADPRHPAAWLATIARNECRGRIERRMREPLAEPVEAESPLPDPVAAAAASMDLAALWRALGELPRRQRQAILLREFSGLSYGELAGALAVSEPAVESLLFRARRDLRLRLRPSYSSAAGIAPLAAIREALARAVGGMPDPGMTGALAKIAAAPMLAKLAAGAAAVVVAGGTVAAVEHNRAIRPQPARAAPVRAVAPVPRPVRPAPVAAVVVAPAKAASLRTRPLRIHLPVLTATTVRVHTPTAVISQPVSAPAVSPSVPPASATAAAGDGSAPSISPGTAGDPPSMPAGGDPGGKTGSTVATPGTTSGSPGGDGSGGSGSTEPGDDPGGTSGSGESGGDTSTTPGTEDGGSGSSGSDDGTEASGGSGSGSGGTGTDDTETTDTSTEPSDTGSGDGGGTTTTGDGGGGSDGTGSDDGASATGGGSGGASSAGVDG